MQQCNFNFFPSGYDDVKISSCIQEKKKRPHLDRKFFWWSTSTIEIFFSISSIRV